jgi:DNA-binding transcriptional LysR family regulator
MELSWSRLQTFRAVVSAGSVTGAARILHVTQPAVSGALRLLEREVGADLLDRSSRRLALTEAGRVLLEHAERLLAIRDEALHAIRELGAGERGRLAVGASETPGHYLLLPFLGRFRKRHPGIALQVVVSNSPTVLQRVADGSIDVGFVEGEPGDPSLTRRLFRTDRLRLILPARDPLASRRRISAADLARRDFVMRDPGSAVRTTVDDALRKAGIAPRIALEFSNTEAVKRAVAAGLGISFIPEASIAPEVSSGRLVARDVPGLVIRRRLWIVRHARRRLSAGAGAFLEMLEEPS